MVPEDWIHNKLSDIAIINPKNSKKLADNDLVTFLAMSDVSEDGRILNYQIRKYKEACAGYTPFENGDIIIAKITPCFENGKGALVTKLLNGVGFGSTEFHVLRPLKNKTSKEFLFQFVSSKYFRKHGEANMVGTAGQKRVPANFISTYRFIFPPLPEQEKIATIFTVWDKAIEKTANLVESKTKLKKALMQQLLTGKLRFNEFSKLKFHRIELGEFLIPTPRPVPRPNSAYTALGIRSHGKGTFLKAVENPEAVMMDTLYEVKEDDLIVNITFAWEGAIAIIKKSDEGALVSHRFPTYVFNRDIIIPKYFKYVIQSKRFVHELGLVSPGGAGRNRVMSKTGFLNIVVSIPPIDEQRKIAAVLNVIDNEIEFLKKKLEYLKTQKKGLMQKLLTGQIRVKV